MQYIICIFKFDFIIAFFYLKKYYQQFAVFVLKTLEYINVWSHNYYVLKIIFYWPYNFKFIQNTSRVENAELVWVYISNQYIQKFNDIISYFLLLKSLSQIYI